MEHILEKIKKIADESHGEQMRKYNPDKYIVHPVRVMKICREYTDDITILATALLHDVLEDTDVPASKLYEFLSSLMKKELAGKIVNMVEELTDQYTKKNYPSLNRVKRKSREHERLGRISTGAQTVKYADIIDNSIDISKHDPDFAPRYLSEGKDLLHKMRDGDPRLRQRAIELVQELKRAISY